MSGIRIQAGASIPNLINICVDRSVQGEIGGRIYHYYEETPQRFDNVVQLLRQMESLYNSLHFPEASVMLRNFSEEKKRKTPKREQKQVLDREAVLAERGECATFYVYVQYRQNATWQGTVVWKEQEQEEEFRSALELIILLDNALANV